MTTETGNSKEDSGTWDLRDYQHITREDFMPSLSEKASQLARKWGLWEYELEKSMMGNTLEIDHKNKLVFVGIGKTDENVWGEVKPERALSLMPDSLLDLLLQSDYSLAYRNGSPGNSYSPVSNQSKVKCTSGMLFEIGNALWYNLVPESEDFKKTALIYAQNPEGRRNKELSDSLLPEFHKEYAALVGAYSGQFLTEDYEDEEIAGKKLLRKGNKHELIENFAENFARLLLGKPLAVMPWCTASIDDFLDFYKSLGIVDEGFESFYKSSIDRHYGGDALDMAGIQNMRYASSVTTNALERVAKIKKDLEAE